MRLFNSFQIVALFAAFPFLAELVREAEFSGSPVAFWVMVAVYFVFFGIIVASVHEATSKWDL